MPGSAGVPAESTLASAEPTDARDSWTAVLALTAAATCLVAATRNKAFQFEAESVVWAVVAAGAAVLAVTGVRTRLGERLGALLTAPSLAAAAVVSVVYTLTHGGAVISGGVLAASHVLPRAALIVGAALALALLAARPGRVMLLIKVALVVVAFTIGAWTVASTPHSIIDFDLMNRWSITALTQGRNPYDLTFPLPYEDLASHYGSGMYDPATRRSTFGYPYPPLALFLIAPGQLLAGDYRYALVVAHAAAVGLIAFAQPGRIGGLAAALFALNPREFFITYFGWNEPLVVALLALTVVAALRLPRLVPVLFGLFLAVKQYAALALPVFLAIGPRLARQPLTTAIAIALLVAVAVTLPLGIADPAAFLRSVVTLQLASPLRPDSISIPALLVDRGLPPTNEVVAIATAAVIAAIVFLRTPRTAGGFASGVLAVSIAFFLLAKQAHLNYYYFLLGAAAISLGAATLPPGRTGPLLPAREAP